MLVPTNTALALMSGRGARNLPSRLGFHDPVYDPSGGQGTAVETFDPNAQQQNPGALLIIAIIIGVILLMGEE